MVRLHLINLFHIVQRGGVQIARKSVLREVLHMTNNEHMTINPAGAIPEMNTLPNRLRVSREYAGLSQTELGAKAELSRNTVSRAEAGDNVPSRATVTVWAFACGVDVEWLRTGNKETPSPDGDGASAESRLRESNPRPIHYKPSAFSLVAA